MKFQKLIPAAIMLQLSILLILDFLIIWNNKFKVAEVTEKLGAA